MIITGITALASHLITAQVTTQKYYQILIKGWVITKLLKTAFLKTTCTNCQSIQSRNMPLAEYEKRENEFSCGICHAPIHFQVERIEEED